MPQSDAGWRIEPPVSLPSAASARLPAPAGAEPPDEPPGTRLVSRGLRVGPNAEFSVELPIANSSIFVRPRKTAPSSLSFSMTVASYEARELSSIFDAELATRPSIRMLSLMASGIPVRDIDVSFDILLSAAFASSRAVFSHTSKYACISGSFFSMAVRYASVNSRAEYSLASNARRASVIVNVERFIVNEYEARNTKYEIRKNAEN